MIYVLAFDPIRIYTLNAFQNDSRNLSFVKHINVVGNKMTINGCKMTISKSCLFFNRTDFTLADSGYYLDSYLVSKSREVYNFWGI